MEPIELEIHQPKTKQPLILFILGIIFLLGGGAFTLFTILRPQTATPDFEFPKLPSLAPDAIYSVLTGETITDASLNQKPTYCIQTPNGTDGARPQAGLDQAGVVFEAIAEAGITRFAAIYQNPTSAAIGPIRSLRMYYLEWDTPFDCTIVHAGGADDALAALKSGGYKDLTENYAYMYRGKVTSRRWNNLFTTATELSQFTADKGYTTSKVTGFTRETPQDANIARVDNLTTNRLDIVAATDQPTDTLAAKVSHIALKFGGMANYNPVYDYDVTTNTYNRSYASGVAHQIYSCPSENLGEPDPERACTLTQLSPSVVIAMKVKEHKASDNYHEVITTTGTGEAYIFQNGTAIKGTWRKNTRAEQIKFYDEAGNEIKLIPGQTWLSAIPDTYGSVSYE